METLHKEMIEYICSYLDIPDQVRLLISSTALYTQFIGYVNAIAETAAQRQRVHEVINTFETIYACKEVSLFRTHNSVLEYILNRKEGILHINNYSSMEYHDKFCSGCYNSTFITKENMIYRQMDEPVCDCITCNGRNKKIIELMSKLHNN